MAQIATTWLSPRWGANRIQTVAAAAACGATMSVSDLSDRTLDALIALLDHLRD